MLIKEFIESKNPETWIKEKIAPIIEKESEKIIEKIKEPTIKEAIKYIMNTGGKKIRPTLCILTAKCYNVENNLSIYPAIASEFLHNALLIHDDIIDGDEFRRNKPTIWKKYGIEQAINIGDYAMIFVYDILKNHPNTIQREKMYRLTTETYLKTIEGQILEEKLKNNNDPTEEEYYEMIIKKTAHYLTYPILLGLILAEVEEEEFKKIIEFGKYFGILYQIQDDLIDLTEGKGRKSIGNDIKEGKRSIFIIKLLEKAKDKSEILEILNKSRKDTTNEDVKKIIALFEEYNIFEEVENIKKQFYEKAKKSLEKIENENLKLVLSKFLEYSINRNK